MRFPAKHIQISCNPHFTRFVSFCSLILVLLLLATGLPAQSLQSTLQAKLAALAFSSKSAILLWDVPRHAPLAAVRGEVFSSPRCVGSLIKPFLLLAYLSALDPAGSEKQFHPCQGHAGWCPVDCWYKPGHGQLDFKSALAVSCNPFFYQLAERVPPDAFFETLRALGVEPSGPLLINNRGCSRTAGIPAQAFIGADPGLRFVPRRVLEAYLNLLVVARALPGERPGSQAPALVVADGLRLSAREGTSILADRVLPAHQHLMGKTGTSPSLVAGEYRSHKTDGWFIGVYPDSQPTVAVLVCHPMGLGAKDAAPLGGQVIRAYLELLK